MIFDRPLRVALIVSVTALVAACGDDDRPGNNTSHPSATSTTSQQSASSEPLTASATATTRPAGTAPDDETALANLIADAEEEGQLIIWASHSPDPLAATVAAFEERYPNIDVTAVRQSDADNIPRLEAEHESGQNTVDFYVAGQPAWLEAQGAEGWFAQPTGPEFSGDGEFDVDRYLSPGGFFEVSGSVFAYAWNTELVPEGISGAEDFLDPKFSGGKIAAWQPLAPIVVGWYLWMEDNFGEEYVEAIAAQEPRIYPSSQPIVQALTSGEIIASNFAPVAAVAPIKDEGAPIDYALPAEDPWGTIGYGVILETAPHPNAAQLFANFLVTREAQEIFSQYGSSPLPDVEGAIVANDQVQAGDPARLTQDATDAYLQKWEELFL